MDIQIKKKHPLVKYKYHLIGGGIFFVLVVALLVRTMQPSKLRYNMEQLIIVEVKSEKFLEYLDTEGIAQPRMTVKLNSAENGIVEKIVAEEGSMLQQGDIIMILSNPELKRTIEDEHDNYEKHRISYEEKMIAMQRKSSELKRTTLKTIYDLERMEKQNELDNEEYNIGIKSKAELEIASKDYTFNKHNTQLLLEELKHDSLMNAIQLDLLSNDLKREQKRLLRSKERLEELIIRAPVTGQLSFISVIPGERVTAGNSIGELKMIEDIKVTTQANEYYIDRISIGLPGTITYQGKKYPLRITKINPEVKVREFEIDLVFVDEKPDNIRIGKSYRIQIELGQPEEALVMGKGNFFQTTGGQWIFKLNSSGDRAIRTPISIGRQNPHQYEVLNGLQDGDKVIISGYDNFGDAQELILK